MPCTSTTDRRLDVVVFCAVVTVKPPESIHGPRQSGKTTLARSVGEPRGYHYVSFDDEAVRRAAQNDPIGFAAGLPRRAILDKVQRVPEVFTSLKSVEEALRLLTSR